MVNCFHVAKLAIETKKKGGQPTPAPSKENKSGPPRKVITFRYERKIATFFGSRAELETNLICGPVNVTIGLKLIFQF